MVCAVPGVFRLPVSILCETRQPMTETPRARTAQEARSSFELARKTGFDNINVDLMSALPGQSFESWQYTLGEAVRWAPEHISAYSLIIEPGTPFASMYENGTLPPLPDEDTDREMYHFTKDFLAEHGYLRYEISNYALAGRECRHNSGYWSGKPYIGIGAAAHSYDGHRRRQWNVSDIERYMAGVEAGTPDTDGEWLTAADSYNDHVMLSLRTSEGLLLESLTAAERAYVLRQAGRYVGDGLMAVSDGRLRLSREGLFVSDMIMSDLMQV
jgi:oxygen-independent coproporphyrinogen-3 oxidase